MRNWNNNQIYPTNAPEGCFYSTYEELKLDCPIENVD